MNYESAAPSVVKSIKQRDLLNNWIRLFVKGQRVPHLDDYTPDRIEEEKPDLVYYDVTYENDLARFKLTYHGSRLADAFGIAGKGCFVEDVIGPKFVPSTMPIYQACVVRGLPTYSIFIVTDRHGSEVAYERLLLPFSSGARNDRMIASCKAISEDGAFEQRNLMHVAIGEPTYTTFAVIDQDLAPRAPTRPPPDDVVSI